MIKWHCQKFHEMSDYINIIYLVFIKSSSLEMEKLKSKEIDLFIPKLLKWCLKALDRKLKQLFSERNNFASFKKVLTCGT